MKIRYVSPLLRTIVIVLLSVAMLPVYASARYDTSISGNLILDTLTGNATVTQNSAPTNFTDHFVDPLGNGSASSSATTTLLTTNDLQVLATTKGSAIPTPDPIFQIGTTSFATGTSYGELKISNPGSSALTLLIQIDTSWAWELLADNLISEAASAALSLDFYADGNYVRSLVNLTPADLVSNGSSSGNETFQVELTDPLATLNGGQSRTFRLVASATSNATAIPEPGTLSLTLLGLAGIGRTLRRRHCATQCQ